MTIGWDIPKTPPTPLQANRISRFPLASVQDMAAHCHAIMMHDVIGLIEKYIHIKATSGSEAEADLYSGMTVADFVDRAIKRRPIAFFGRHVSAIHHITPDMVWLACCIYAKLMMMMRWVCRF